MSLGPDRAGPVPPGGTWLVLVPVKSTLIGKSRLSLPAAHRAQLARAMALDTVTAAAAAGRDDGVLVLVDDDSDGRMLAEIDRVAAHRSGVTGLNAAIREALCLPQVSHRSVAVLPADLPSLTPTELDGALAVAESLALSVVADRQGSGTTMLAARDASLLMPQYGVGSFAAHVAGGAVPLAVSAASGLRRDVDVLADLDDVTGPLTCAEVAALGADTATG